MSKPQTVIIFDNKAQQNAFGLWIAGAFADFIAHTEVEPDKDSVVSKIHIDLENHIINIEKDDK